MTRPAVALAGLCATASLTGCSTKIDAAKGERLIRKTVTDQVGAKVRSVHCPKDLTAKQGATFHCTVVGADGTTGQALVTERNDKGDVGVDAPFLHTIEVERIIAADLKRKVGGTVRVNCPEIVRVERRGRFSCHGHTGRSSARIAVTQLDAHGHVRYAVKS